MFLVPLLFIILIVWFIMYLFRATTINTPTTTIHNNTSSVSNKPMEILKERYAKGDITEEEYLRVKRNLE